jgi:hypothetical protein
LYRKFVNTNIFQHASDFEHGNFKCAGHKNLESEKTPGAKISAF